MKKTSIFFGILLLSKLLEAQFTVGNYILPNPGNEYVFNQNLNNRLYTPEAAGTNKTFDFSSLTKDEEYIITYLSATNPLYPTANMMTLLGEGPAAIRLYLKKTLNDLVIVGMEPNIDGLLPFPTKFSFKNGLKYIATPLTISSPAEVSSDSAIITIPAELINEFINIDSLMAANSPIRGAQITTDSIQLVLIMTSNIKADAHGKISTPKEPNVDVMRVVRTLLVDYKIIAFLKVSIFGFSQNLRQDITPFLGDNLPQTPPIVTHSFFDQKNKNEVVFAFLDSTGTAYNQILWRDKIVLDTLKPKDSLSIGNQNRLNPSIYFLNNSLVLENLDNLALLNLYDLSGKKVLEFELQKSTPKNIPIRLPIGIYTAIAIGNDGQTYPFKLYNSK